MEFRTQNTGGVFVAWGSEKAKDNSFVVEKGESIEGVVLEIHESDKYGIVLELKTKECDDPIVIPGTTILRRGLGYETDEDGKILPEDEQSVVKAGGKRVMPNDVIRILFGGMTQTKHGEAYDLLVAVAVPEKGGKK